MKQNIVPSCQVKFQLANPLLQGKKRQIYEKSIKRSRNNNNNGFKIIQPNSNKVLGEMNRSMINIPLKKLHFKVLQKNIQYNTTYSPESIQQYHYAKLKEEKRKLTNQISIEDFEIGQLLGKGSIGDVYTVRHKFTGFFFALKKIKKKNVDKDLLMESIKIHYRLQNPAIVNLFAFFSDQNFIYLLLELCIDDNLAKWKRNKWSEQNCREMMFEVIKGIKYLHKYKIRHGDIKLENIFVCYSMPKIGDLQCLIQYQKGNYDNSSFEKIQMNGKQMIGSPIFFSPEMISNKTMQINDDIWSFGILMYELVSGQYPFNITQNGLNYEVKSFNTKVSEGIKKIILRILDVQSINRPNIDEIIYFLGE